MIVTTKDATRSMLVLVKKSGYSLRTATAISDGAKKATELFVARFSQWDEDSDNVGTDADSAYLYRSAMDIGIDQAAAAGRTGGDADSYAAGFAWETIYLLGVQRRATAA